MALTEREIMNEIMLRVSATGTRLFRNNCGMLLDKSGRRVRFGVANPGGSDLIGWSPVKITPDMVGKTLAVFTAIEVKTAKGKPSKEQVAFMKAVKNSGGVSAVVKSVDDLETALIGG